MPIFILFSVAIFAQSKFKNKIATEENTATNTAVDVPINIKKPTNLGTGVPLASPSPFANGLENFKPLAAKKPTITNNALQVMRDADGEIIMIKGLADENTDANRNTERRVQDYLTAINAELRLNNAANEFRITQNETDEFGIEHVRLQQKLNNVDIYGGEIILHGKNKQFDVMNGRFYPTPTIKNLTPTISERSAQDFVEIELKKQGVATHGLHQKLAFAGKNKAKLVIYHKDKNKTAEALAWHLTLHPNTLQRFEYFVDAQTGAVIHFFNHTCNFVGEICAHHHEVEEVLPPVDGPATVNDAIDLLGVPRTLNTHIIGSTYYMIDSKRTMFSTAKSKLPDEPVGAIWTLDAFNDSPEKSTFSYDHVKSTNNAWSNKTAVSAHYNGGIAYDYFKKTHNRESINGKGGTIISLINIAEKNGASMENAFWNGDAMFYGNGGSAFSPLARGLDVAGHEMSHGVIQETAGLEYQGESGAMNESFADIFGAMIDRNDWQVGEDVVKKTAFPSGALRDLSNPNNGGASLNDPGWQPKSVSEQYKGTQDNGGVHINSGITNFAYYKFATATTKEKAEKVFYNTLIKYLVKSSKFIDLRAGVVQSATDIYGANSAEVTQVKAAFDAVGIGGGGNATGDNYQTNVGVNPGTDFVAYNNNDYLGINILDVAKNTSIKVSSSKISSRTSVTDNGGEMVYISNKKPYLINFDWTKNPPFTPEKSLADQTIFKNVVISKNGNLLAVTTLPDDNKITVFDFSKNPTTQKTFTLYNPTYTQGVSTGNVQFSDALEFDITGEYLMYDAYNDIKGKSGNIKYWDIGFLRVYDNKAKNFGDGKIEKLFADLPEQTSVGNPQFSKNSPYIITFDYIDEYEKKSYIESANLQTGKTGTLHTYSGAQFGFPVFSRKDDKVIFEDEDFLGNYMATVDLNTDKLSPKANTFKILKDNTRFPMWFSNGVRKLNVGTEDNLLTGVKIYPNPFDATFTIEANEVLDNKNVEIFDVLGKKITEQRLFIGKNNINLDNAPNGTYILKVGNSTKKLIKM
jgi:bacillolysin